MIETRIGLEEEKLYEKLPKIIEMERMLLIQAHRNTWAWKWLLAGDLLPKFKDMEIVHSHLDDQGSSLYIHVLINRREDVQPYLDLFENDENWELYNEDKDLAKRVGTDWNKGPYIGYNYNPTNEYVDRLTELFGGKLAYTDREISFSQYQFDVYLYFFPAEEGECAITNLGKVKTTIEHTVFEVTCKEGAIEGF